jgi:hypothetical protein
VKFQLRLTLITFLFLLPSSYPAFAQTNLGVEWKVPDNREAALGQLQQFHELGISVIEISSLPRPEVWKTIDTLGFDVYGNLGIYFPVTQTFAKPDSSLIHLVETKASAYLSQSSVKAIGLFNFGAVTQEKFRSAIIPFVKQLKGNDRVKVYFTSDRLLEENVPGDFYLYRIEVSPEKRTITNLPDGSKIGGYQFSPAPEISDFISPFEHFWDATSRATPKPVFCNSDWLFNILHKHPQFASTIQSLTRETNPIFPVPRESLPQPEKSAIPVIILFLVWGLAAFHFNTSPLYRKSLFRYFGAHKFFIDDIFHRQIRSPLPAFLIIIQNTCLLAACSFAAFMALWSPIGKESLFFHYPTLAILGRGPYSLLLWSLGVFLVFSLLSIFWLFISNRKSNSFTQVATIYAWPLQINFIICTLAIATYSAGGSGTTVATFTIIACFVFFSSFILTSLDVARFRTSRPLLYLFSTIGLYLIFTGILFGWILAYGYFQEVIALSLSLT